MSTAFSQNHELHGILFGLVAASVFGMAGRDLGTSLTVGSVVAGVSLALMKTFGHPKILSQYI